MLIRRICIPLFYAFSLIFCRNKDIKEPSSLKILNDNLNTAVDSLGWQLIDSLPLQVVKSIKNKSIAVSATITLDTKILPYNRILMKSTMEFKGHKFGYSAIYTRSKNFDLPAGYAEKIVSATLEFDNHIVSLSKCKIINFNGDKMPSESGITLSNTLKVVHMLNLGDSEYCIFNVGSFGCGLCPADVTLIIRKNDENIDFFLVNDIYPGTLIKYDNWFWADINNDECPDFYQMLNANKENRNGQYIYTPSSLINDRLVQLNGFDKFKLDLINNRYCEVEE